MASLIRFGIFLITCALSIGSVEGAELPPETFSSWLNNFETEALADGISSTTIKMALESALLDERVVNLDHRQPEATQQLDTYLQNVITPERVKEGHSLLQRYASLLNKISDEYGVQPEIIVALWGIESSFGRHKGNFNVVDSLITLAFEGRRSEFFRRELMSTLHIIDKNHIPATALRGSWAGAMGQCQFMPSTYLHYAVDYDSKGYSDIWGHTADVFASIAHYIASEGWNGHEIWGQEVQFTGIPPLDKSGLDQSYPLDTWTNLGVRDIGDAPLEERNTLASLILPDGPGGRGFLVYDNYRALLKWNRSTYFATAVGLLADRIK